MLQLDGAGYKKKQVAAARVMVCARRTALAGNVAAEGTVTGVSNLLADGGGKEAAEELCLRVPAVGMGAEGFLGQGGGGIVVSAT